MLNLDFYNARSSLGLFALVSALALAGGCSTKALDQGGSSDGATGDSNASAGGTGETDSGADSDAAGTAGSTAGSTDGSTSTGTSATAMESASSSGTGSNGTAGTTGATEGTAGTATDVTDSSSGSDSDPTSTTGQPDDCVGLDKETCDATPGCYAFWGWPVLEMDGGLCTGDEMFVECGPDPGGCDDVISYGCDGNDDVIQFPDSCLPPSLESCDVGQFPEPC